MRFRHGSEQQQMIDLKERGTMLGVDRGRDMLLEGWP